MACNAARRRCDKMLRQGTTARQCGRRCAAYGKTLRKDTAARHYGKALRQALRKDSQEDTAVFHAARHHGKTLRQALRQEDTTTRHCGTVARKCDMWQESATCVMALRHATATKPKKEGVGGGRSRRSARFGHISEGTYQPEPSNWWLTHTIFRLTFHDFFNV